MRKIIQITVLYFLIFCTTTSVFGQEKVANDPDVGIKEILYSKYKRQVRAFDKNDFDTLFFEFFEKQNDPKLILTKEEFYTYTIKIAIYSEKLGLLYKNQKEESQKTKQEWFNKSYADYLKSKK
jgi:hypothetical protein